MAIRMDYVIKRARKRWLAAAGSNAELNKIFRESLMATASFWIDNYLPLHFGNQAMSRYGYARRSQRFLRRKAIVRPDLVPPSPMEYTGELKEYLLGKARSGAMLNASKAISTGVSKKNPNGKLRVTIPIRIPHPINPKNKGELSRVTRQERRAMNQVFIAELERRLDQSPTIIEYERINAAA